MTGTFFILGMKYGATLMDVKGPYVHDHILE